VNWVVAVEEGLEEINEYLRNMGFKIVSLENENLAVDAVVYKNMSLSEIQAENLWGSTNSSYDYNGEKDCGVLLVNAHNKTPQQIYEIIKNRVYEHII